MKPIHNARCAILLAGWLACSALAPTREASAAGPWGEVHFPISCQAGVQPAFDQAVAMLHSYEFGAAGKTFTAVARDDPTCSAFVGKNSVGQPSPRAGRRTVNTEPLPARSPPSRRRPSCARACARWRARARCRRPASNGEQDRASILADSQDELAPVHVGWPPPGKR
jgi:hypothetical protein